MSLKAPARLLSPEEIAVQAGQQVPFLRLPERATVFAEREMRLRQRAAGHPMRDFLLFVAELSHAQHDLLGSYPTVPLPDAAAIDVASRLGAPPLPSTLWPRTRRGASASGASSPTCCRGWPAARHSPASRRCRRPTTPGSNSRPTGCSTA